MQNDGQGWPLVERDLDCISPLPPLVLVEAGGLLAQIGSQVRGVHLI